MVYNTDTIVYRTIYGPLFKVLGRHVQSELQTFDVVSCIIAYKIDVSTVNSNAFSLWHPFEVDKRWPRTLVSWTEVKKGFKPSMLVYRSQWWIQEIGEEGRATDGGILKSGPKQPFPAFLDC